MFWSDLKKKQLKMMSHYAHKSIWEKKNCNHGDFGGFTVLFTSLKNLNMFEKS